MASIRMSGQQRREQVLDVAEEEFAVTGLHGASTETIAHRAGITQAYVFRLFGTKRQLFLACVDAAFERMRLAMAAAAGDPTPPWTSQISTRDGPGRHAPYPYARFQTQDTFIADIPTFVHRARFWSDGSLDSMVRRRR